eukprot:c9126_g1_i3.p2 GENE.c9126_g1_i3~~c9126_g1_i3.p2  ORF type:complete len:197 (-),score=65.57 c9126_g1_i3:28-618(-)
MRCTAKDKGMASVLEDDDQAIEEEVEKPEPLNPELEEKKTKLMQGMQQDITRQLSVMDAERLRQQQKMELELQRRKEANETLQSKVKLAELKDERDEALMNVRRLKAELERKNQEIAKLKESVDGAAPAPSGKPLSPNSSRREIERLKKLYASATDKLESMARERELAAATVANLRKDLEDRTAEIKVLKQQLAKK